ncbi:MAG: AAA family ATPase, partial [Clostridia bacterium]|nr:AAA family ATPase [Clostridia bacterium]
MKINKIKINGFGRFINKEISFGSGLNLVYGRNEAGKSTLQNFIKATLYGFTNQRTDGEGRPPEKLKYKPWDSGDYNGFIEVIKKDGTKIRIERNFETNETLVFDENLTNITSSFDYQARAGIKVGENLFGIDRESFENSVCIGQGNTAVTQNDRNHMFERIVNIMNTGKEDESASSALAAISKAQRNLGNSRTQDKPYNKALSAVESIEREFSSARQKNIDMSENMKRKQFLEEEIVRLKSEISHAESLEQSEKIS